MQLVEDGYETITVNIIVGRKAYPLQIAIRFQIDIVTNVFQK